MAVGQLFVPFLSPFVCYNIIIMKKLLKSMPMKPQQHLLPLKL